jgi:hypothetical protein
MGEGALANNSTASNNTGIGTNAGLNISTGNNNTAVGYAALGGSSGLTATNNEAFGFNALNVCTGSGCTNNVAIGSRSQNANTGAGQNVAVGQSSLRNTTGADNTAFGYQALQANTTGQQNVGIGYQVGNTTLATGTNNILIGTSNAVDTAASGTNYNLNIGNLLQGDMTNSTALGKEVLFLQSTASSVDYVQIAGGATGNPGTVTVTAAGTDSNINLNFVSKGTGTVQCNGSSCGGTNTYQAVIQPSSYYTTDTAGNLFPNVYAGGGGNASTHDAGWGVAASLGSDVTLELRFQMPAAIPTGTFKLVTYCLANASSGVVKYTISDADVANGASPSAATLTGETQTSITWAAVDQYVVTKTPLTHSTPAANDVSIVAIKFQTSGWTLAQIMTCSFTEIVE